MTNDGRWAWSDFQRAIYADIAEGAGHTVVKARAGAAKTTTIMHGMTYVPVGKGFGLSVAMFAFNKSIAQVLQDRAPKGVRVATFHSYAFSAVRRAFPNVRVDDKKARRLLDELYPRQTQDRQWCSAIAKAAGLAKGLLIEDADGVDRIIDEFGIDAGDEGDSARGVLVKDVLWLLDRAARDVSSIDFDDMVWFPIKHDLRLDQYDRVFVDETQDLNACQLELAVRACKPGGRICAVGDERQCIYKFRGADSDAIQRIVDRLDAKVLPLSVTYRCGKAIAQLAATEVPDFEAAETNPEGFVSSCGESEMVKRVAPGDFILSRTNAPLIKLCLGFIRAGRAANIAGRDVGAGLVALIDKSKAKTVDEILEWMATWQSNEIARRLRKDPDADVTDIEDRAGCVEALCEGETSVAHLRAKIEGLFTDKGDGERIVLSTVHKAKGLERDRVFMLADTFRRSRKGQAPSQEERNLWYVAVTRARHELWMVSREVAA